METQFNIFMLLFILFSLDISMQYKPYYDITNREIEYCNILNKFQHFLYVACVIL